ncbi:nucleoside phosphorylase [Paenibacillus endoradicis]|uniref:nucleoside phosphorylase n=1 Tax=Paenibacillus endoradicis TaxID=2972487 RepID=UPI002158E13B|nr:nucleoside phosphorylase [Paenibacillus endoradicis]MCR8655788.1 nucleoside phosphorylase [Paenibacillus endoradicis]MCR8658114.1 nucleoside phosphorylase [Paenibacillus endoradicis]
MFLSILEVNSEQLPGLAIVCGDPRRAKKIADMLTDSVELSFAREYRTFVGSYKGVQLAVVSHGVGCPGAAVCFEELIKGGVHTIIRVGTAGSYSADHPAGSLIVSTGTIRTDGLTKQLVPDGFPAIGDSEVVNALFASAEEQGGIVKKGITVTLDVFFNGPVEIPHKLYKASGALAVEMEIASLYVIASLRGIRAGAIVALDGYADSDLAEGYDPHTNVVSDAVEREIKAALEAMVKLA